MSVAVPDADYFDHNYGVCALDPCPCLHRIFKGEHTWLGMACVYWRPLGVRSWEELAQRAREATQKGQAT